MFFQILQEREQLTDSAVALNKTTKDIFLIATRLYGHLVFFP